MVEAPAEPDLPRVLGNANDIAADALQRGTAGAVWKVPVSPRDLDANIVHVPADEGIGTHFGPDLDVLVVVLDGSGVLVTDAGSEAMTAGSLVWLPRRSRRTITASSSGLTYLTVHQRRPGLTLRRTPPEHFDPLAPQ